MIKCGMEKIEFNESDEYEIIYEGEYLNGKKNGKGNLKENI